MSNFKMVHLIFYQKKRTSIEEWRNFFNLWHSKCWRVRKTSRTYKLKVNLKRGFASFLLNLANQTCIIDSRKKEHRLRNGEISHSLTIEMLTSSKNLPYVQAKSELEKGFCYISTKSCQSNMHYWFTNEIIFLELTFGRLQNYSKKHKWHSKN